MEIEVISFGKITEFVAKQQLTITGIENTDELKSFLEARFPQLTAMKYKLAVNQMLVQDNQPLKHGDAVALMPPFSGG